ncbi:amylo-alpha-1,6-glucosidase [Paenibacillus alvei]|uniref:amylo-alpha-1,6-glucosidase n=1 Tax=Paenibacillus alvei TaxID=44250 RepID=UPI0018CD9BE8|nr:trehalase family glycosidase [Paenibacillus alvei]MCY9582084.1 hypothetical protein [Paenibacillus alvei]MCY9587686.1 hypothetical protein [Paenibacillus alvei]
MSATIPFDIHHIPFSRFGTFLTVSYLPQHGKREEGLYFRTVRGGDDTSGAVFRLELMAEDQVVPYSVHPSPSSLTLLEEGGQGRAELCLPETGAMRIRARGAGIRLTLVAGSYDYVLPHQDGRYEVNHFTTEMRFMLTLLQGELAVDAPWERSRCKYAVVECSPTDAINNGTAEAELMLEEYRIQPPAIRTLASVGCFDEAVAGIKQEFDAWLDKSLPVALEELEEARALAAYITWSCVVPEAGHLSRPAMYMSKNWMTNIWSWDHCFNAMALAANQPELAWDQFMIMFDKQDESGQLPDFINDKYALWNCCKPPIHGWTLRWMMERNEWFRHADRLREIYDPLAQWSKWWMNCRDDDHDGIPQYNHGNDSGWDNSTIFRCVGPIESPDLSAYLIIQFEVLAEIAEQLGKAYEAAEWRNAANSLLGRMMEHFWQGGQFRAIRSGTHEPAQGDSLIPFMPILLGDRLPESVLQALVKAVADEERFFSPNGFATESLNSPFYEPDGYWLGPIWAPVMMLLIDGLQRSGQREVAQEAAIRFCRMASRSGMAENFDAKTGCGLRDRAFTWTSSVFLILANEYVNQPLQ